ncbi:MAG: DUF975 family protein [Bacilli bacterium]|mgnify:CR=1 FL=1|jgi:uncharacterized membrane protein|nr:DUF975 family protein [Bacilli bacterium]
MEIREIKKEAKALIKGQVLMIFVVLLLMGAVSGMTSGLLSPVLAFGFYLIVNDLIMKKELDFNRFVEPFRNLNQALKLVVVSLLYGIFVMLGLILLIIPGIIISLMYSQAIFIMMDDPDIDIFDAFRKSKEMMQGYKTHLFVFGLSFIGHYLLILITFGLWSIYALPFFEVSRVNYYLHLKKVSKVPLSEEKEPVVTEDIKDEDIIDNEESNSVQNDKKVVE